MEARAREADALTRPKRVENELLVPPEATKLQVTSELIDRPSGAVAETIFRSRSRCCASASIARALACFLMTLRTAGAISPGGRMPAATWYSSGWKRW